MAVTEKSNTQAGFIISILQWPKFVSTEINLAGSWVGQLQVGRLFFLADQHI